jgi:hypothetical protein
VPPEVLDNRTLNRALLARQGLLERSAAPALEMVERLVGMQAQVPGNPYVGLWSRIAGFRPEALSEAIADRRAVRASALPATIHLLSARDCLAIQPITGSVLAKSFQGQFGRRLTAAGADTDAVVAAGRELLAERPRTRAEIRNLLAPRWPDVDPELLGHAAVHLTPLVQIPPRGLWEGRGQATWSPTEQWLGAELDPEPSVDRLLLRYLTALGPASTADIRTWSTLTGLREVVERLRPRLQAFHDESGRELLDVEDGLFADPDTPAPPRFLPEYDNLMLSHADRSRVLAGVGPGLPFPRGGTVGTLLADGLYRANWQLAEQGGTAVLTIDRFARLPSDPSGTLAAVEDEAAGLVRFLAPAAGAHEVRFVPQP